jgi:exonuclease SbcD
LKLLHTSDWHLGRLIETQSRLEEQEAFLDDLIACAQEASVDVILIAGDIYDTYNPPAKAEKLFFEKIKALADNGRRLVVIVSGNHDMPLRLGAAEAWAAGHGVLLCTDLTAVSEQRRVGQFDVLNFGPGALSVQIGTETLNLALLPFPSESRLGEILSESGEENELQQSYSDRVKSLLTERCAHFTPEGVGVVVSHLFVSGGALTDSERKLQWGGGYTVFGEAFPASADYVALGHLHKPQSAPGLKDRGRYSGSPLQYSRSEIGYSKSVTLIQATPGHPVEIEERFIKTQKPVEIWRAVSFEAAERLLEAEAGRSAWVYLEVETPRPLHAHEIKRLKSLYPELLSIEPVIPVAVDAPVFDGTVEAMNVLDMFRRFYEREVGSPPEEEIMTRFTALVSEEDSNEAG